MEERQKGQKSGFSWPNNFNFLKSEELLQFSICPVINNGLHQLHVILRKGRNLEKI